MQQQTTFKDNRGFTIIEMIVVISIFAIMAGLVLFRYRDYQANINLENTTQDIALQIQKAEVDAISGRYPSLALGQIPPPATWKPSFGVYFDTATPKQFKYFYDYQSYFSDDTANYVPFGASASGGTLPGARGVMDGGSFSCGSGGTECLSVTNITNDASVQKICYGAVTSSSCTGTTSPDNVSIVFTRPFPDREAITVVSNAAVILPEDVRIRIGSDTTTRKRDIVITPLGQIRVEIVQ
jgi:prepilin-type N-terminal cleavage/methylation domain-containing protein